MFFYFVVPVSDSGKAEEAWDLRICFSFDRGFAPASCAKITFRNHALFGYFLERQKVTKLNRLKISLFLVIANLKTAACTYRFKE
jgi:hypothetical protein